MSDSPRYRPPGEMSPPGPVLAPPWAWERTRTPARLPVRNAVLFGVTLLTTTLAGALNLGLNPLADPRLLLYGLPFSATLMSILLFHEMGHYLLSRRHGVRATLPFFLPGPPPAGTFGAFIRMQGPPATRRALFDVGAAGPWAGLAVAVPAVVVGLALSEVRPLSPGTGGLVFGDSILFSALARWTLGVSPDRVTIVLHPIAVAGWFGLFVTALNLLPVGQLDGGHVVYALCGRHHRWISRAFLAGIVALGVFRSASWLVWALLVSLIGIDHPPTQDRTAPLDLARRLGAVATLAVFALTFVQEPIRLDLPTRHAPQRPAAVQMAERS